MNNFSSLFGDDKDDASLSEPLSLAYLLADDDDEIDEDEEEEIYFLLLCLATQYNKSIKYDRTRISWEDHVTLLQHENMFSRTYRMSLSAFNNLVQVLYPRICFNLKKAMNSCGEPISPQIVIAIGLRWLAGGSYLDIKTCYSVSSRSIYRCRDVFISPVKQCIRRFIDKVSRDRGGTAKS